MCDSVLDIGVGKAVKWRGLVTDKERLSSAGDFLLNPAVGSVPWFGFPPVL